MDQASADSASQRNRKGSSTRSALRRVGLAMLAIAGISCSSIPESAVEITYDRADWLLKRRIVQYVDLDARQLDQLEHHLQRLHAWHRSVELPRCAELLERAADRLEARLRESDVHVLMNGARERWDSVANALVRELRPLLVTISTQQQVQIVESLRRDGDRFQKVHVAAGVERSVLARTERLAAQVERWTGKLSDEQQGLVLAVNQTTPEFPAIRLIERRRLQERVGQALTQRDPEIAAAAIHDLLTAPIRSRDPAYRAAVSRYDSALAGMLLRLDHSLSRQQRDRAVERLRRMARKLRAMAAETPQT